MRDLRRPTRSRSPILASSCPSMITSPLVGLSSAARMDSSVVLPDPLGPTTAMNSPGYTRNETWSSAFTAWPSSVNVLTNSRTSRTASLMVPSLQPQRLERLDAHGVDHRYQPACRSDQQKGSDGQHRAHAVEDQRDRGWKA